MFIYQLLTHNNIYEDHFNSMTFAQGMSLDVDIGMLSTLSIGVVDN